MGSTAVDITLPRLGRCLRVEGAPEVVEALAQAMPGWPMTLHPAQGQAPELYIYRDADGLWQGSHDEADELDLPSSASAVCRLVGELVGRRLAVDTSLLGLHCGSVQTAGQLVVFPESSKAGKSTLSVAFAAAGYRVFGDDVLGLTAQGEGVAMGMAPRLRMPLPGSFSTEFVEYAERHAGPEDEGYRFVIPAAGCLAGYAEASPIGTIVLLERAAQIVEPQVLMLSTGEGLLQLLWQNFAASDTPNQALLERLLPLVDRVQCLLLRYSEPLAGARHLAKVIEDASLPRAGGVSLLSCAPVDVVSASICGLSSIWLPAENVSAYPLAQELFLIHTPSGEIHRLNASGKVVWELLQHEPLSGYALSDVLAAYFNVPLARVTVDVATLIAALAQAQLVTAQ